MEVEAKFPLKEPDKLKKLLAEKGSFLKRKLEEDIYFNSPLRDFKESDEALRVRKDEEGVTITYKGPKLDSETKTREEIKIKVDDFEKAVELLKKLGFKPVREVKKIRELYEVEGVLVCVDHVFNLGDFVEFEIDSEDVGKAKEKIFRLAEELGFKREDSLRESYLEMLERVKSNR
ncbi:class IV adenylate cyclase [Ferroglobus sp.]|uniref:class IV adenylate cyclase n=1 Tax=Ferroglobus sp. TaxID=2614230 RepID=UPI0025C19F54|nr:class IV adenylate cyclase [Ferroglobus sp.]